MEKPATHSVKEAARRFGTYAGLRRVWRLAVVPLLLLPLCAAARAQGGFGSHPRGAQQGSQMPRSEPAQRNGRSAQGGNSMFPATPANAGARNGLQAGPPGRWWDDHHVAQTVGLRHEQKARMDAIFNANKPAILGAYQALTREQARYAELSRQTQPDKAQMFASIDAVNEARTSLEKATAQMLLEIRSEMDAAQLAKLGNLR